MFKLLPVIAVGTSLLLSPCHAFNLAERLVPHANHALKEGAIKEQYVDFTGSWSGTCSITSAEGNFQDDVIFNIENDAYYITLEGEEIEIGASVSKTSSNSKATYTSHEMYMWNADKTQLTVKSVTALTEYANKYRELPLIEHSPSTVTLSIKNEELIVNGEFTVVMDSGKKGIESVNCHLSKSK